MGDVISVISELKMANKHRERTKIGANLKGEKIWQQLLKSGVTAVFLLQ